MYVSETLHYDFSVKKNSLPLIVPKDALHFEKNVRFLISHVALYLLLVAR